MIVNKSSKGFHIINHAAHGMLAGNIGSYIQPNIMPEYRFETLVAITEHDDRQLNFKEKDYLSNLGIPLDFTENSATVTQVYKRMKRVIKSVKNKSSWIRMLVSFHLEFLYSDLRSESKKIDAFLTEEENKCETILKNYNCTIEQGSQYYEILRFCDRLSLILCKDETPNQGRTLEINTSINKKTYFISKLTDNKITVTPWIFNCDEFKISIEEKILETPSFDSSRDFQNEFENTIPNLKSWVLSKTKS